MRQPLCVFERTASIRDAVGELLNRSGFEVARISEKNALLRCLSSRPFEAVMLGPSAVGEGDDLGIARQVRDCAAAVPLLLLVPKSSERLAIAALQAGINEYIRYPYVPEELIDAVKRCLSPLEAGAPSPADFLPAHGMIGESAAMQEIRRRVAKIAFSDSNVLITGETGTGKELLAQAVHNGSPRRSNTFVAINCAAIPDSLLESELFGYAKGSFTGADAGRDGKLKAADRGTVFLDEIGDMSGYAQAKILRLIESKEIQRLGCSHGIPVDVRIIAATNQDLEMLSRENKFRKDLYFRLNVARIHLPPLRERREDFLPLVDHFLACYNQRFKSRVRGFSDAALGCLAAYDWPGNVRELKNLLESIFVEGPAEEIALTDLPPHFRLRCAELRLLAGNERERLLWALAASNWNKSKAADKLNWSRMTLYRKMARYNILRAG
jgi:DNA-binding NtrC family response regulator